MGGDCVVGGVAAAGARPATPALIPLIAAHRDEPTGVHQSEKPQLEHGTFRIGGASVHQAPYAGRVSVSN